ncbi:unnamed protein product, partial [Mesorhabditis spiculigera]
MVQNVYVSAVTPDNISRTELLAWVNDSLQSSFSKIEEMSTGTGYCLFTDMLFNGQIPLKRVKWNSKNEVDHINNWKVLQTAWKNIGIDKPVPVERLLKAKFQDNFEFLQWFKKFFDANYSGEGYDPVAARGGEALPLGGKAPMNRGVAPRPAAAPRPAPAAARPAAVPRAAPAAVTRQPLAPVAQKVVVNKTGAEHKLIEEQKERIEQLEEQASQYVDSIEQLEAERNYYFERLRQVEELVTAIPEEQQDETLKKILKVIYSDGEEEAAAPEGQQQQDATFEDQVKKPNGDHHHHEKVQEQPVVHQQAHQAAVPQAAVEEDDETF